jgi:hypothetical protein
MPVVHSFSRLINTPNSFLPRVCQSVLRSPHAVNGASFAGIAMDEVCRRVTQCLTEKLVMHTCEPSFLTVLWKCVGDHMPKPPAEGETVPMNNNLDNNYRFTILATSTGTTTVSVAIKFVSGLNRTMESFWRIADSVEGDVRRTNRAWRRRLAKSSDPTTASKE